MIVFRCYLVCIACHFGGVKPIGGFPIAAVGPPDVAFLHSACSWQKRSLAWRVAEPVLRSPWRGVYQHLQQL
ncbi:hypothetical protein BDV26DRAFT_259855, partial [Aspergillus bertholletiae]